MYGQGTVMVQKDPETVHVDGVDFNDGAAYKYQTTTSKIIIERILAKLDFTFYNATDEGDGFAAPLMAHMVTTETKADGGSFFKVNDHAGRQAIPFVPMTNEYTAITNSLRSTPPTFLSEQNTWNTTFPTTSLFTRRYPSCFAETGTYAATDKYRLGSSAFNTPTTTEAVTRSWLIPAETTGEAIPANKDVIYYMVPMRLSFAASPNYAEFPSVTFEYEFDNEFNTLQGKKYTVPVFTITEFGTVTGDDVITGGNYVNPSYITADPSIRRNTIYEYGFKFDGSTINVTVNNIDLLDTVVDYTQRNINIPTFE